MLKISKYALVVLSAVAVGHTTSVVAGAVTSADFAGKKICWSNGNIATYGKDGSADCSQCGHGTWRLVADTLTENYPSGSLVWKVTKDGRTFHMSLQSAPYEVKGSYCK